MKSVYFHSEGLRHILCVCVMAQHVGWIIEVLLRSELGMPVLLHIHLVFSVCVCPPICVGLAGGQSDGGIGKLDVALYTSVLSL